jgi:GxxExxY protein
MLRVPSPLPEDLESLVTEIIGLCIDVHRELGPGLNETVYARACGVELEARGISYESEYPVPIRYRGQLLCHQRIDLFIEGRVVLELKSLDAIHRVHVSQTVTYLRLTRAKVGLIVNFNVEFLRYGIRRVIL